jgi:hypothetical protein
MGKRNGKGEGKEERKWKREEEAGKKRQGERERGKGDLKWPKWHLHEQGYKTRALVRYMYWYINQCKTHNLLTYFTLSAFCSKRDFFHHFENNRTGTELASTVRFLVVQFL